MTKRALIKYIILYCILIVLLLRSITLYDQETPQNTERVCGIMQDFERHTSHRGPSYVTFTVNGKQYVYLFEKEGEWRKEVLSKLQKASDESVEVSLIISGDVRSLPIFWGSTEAVEISTGTDMIASIDVHNRYQRIRLVIWTLVIGIAFAALSMYIFFFENLNIKVKKEAGANCSSLCKKYKK